MKILSKVKDGGPYSKVTAYFLIEAKKAFSIGLLRFDEGSREAYHSHAFDCVSWLLKGELDEHLFHATDMVTYKPSLQPIVTRKRTFHKVFGIAKTSWVLTFRGPWVDTWREWIEGEGRFVTLTHGRKEIEP